MDIRRIGVFLYVALFLLHIIVEARSLVNENDLDKLETAVNREVEDGLLVLHQIDQIRKKLHRNRREHDSEENSASTRRRRGHRNNIMFRLFVWCRNQRISTGEWPPNCSAFGGNRDSDNTEIISTDS